MVHQFMRFIKIDDYLAIFDNHILALLSLPRFLTAQTHLTNPSAFRRSNKAFRENHVLPQTALAVYFDPFYVVVPAEGAAVIFEEPGPNALGVE
jgi:hypothetical protein